MSNPILAPSHDNSPPPVTQFTLSWQHDRKLMSTVISPAHHELFTVIRYRRCNYRHTFCIRASIVMNGHLRLLHIYVFFFTMYSICNSNIRDQGSPEAAILWYSHLQNPNIPFLAFGRKNRTYACRLNFREMIDVSWYLVKWIAVCPFSGVVTFLMMTWRMMRYVKKTNMRSMKICVPSAAEPRYRYTRSRRSVCCIVGPPNTQSTKTHANSYLLVSGPCICGAFK